VDSEGRTLWIVDAHRDSVKRFVVRSDEMLSAFLELERITHELAPSALNVKRRSLILARTRQSSAFTMTPET
jgi:hypothetical protein